MDRDPSHLRDILNAGRHALELAAATDREGFEHDWIIQAAVERKLEIVGEAAKRLSESFRQDHPGLPWKRIAGFRDILIHHYDRIDYDVVWNVLLVDLPLLVKFCDDRLPDPDSFPPP